MKENQRPLWANGQATMSNGHAANGHQTVDGRPNAKQGRISTDTTSSLQDTTSKPDTSTNTSKQDLSKKYKHAFAVHHQNRTSCLSREATESVSFIGFKNLAFSILACSILRLMLENFKKYGIRVTLSSNGPPRRDLVLGTILYLTVPVHLFLAYGIEVLAAKYAMGAVGRVKRSENGGNQVKQLDRERSNLKRMWWMIAGLHGINATFNLVFSTAVVYNYILNPGIGMISELHAVIVWLKVCSYAFANRDLRHALLKHDPTETAVTGLYKECPYPRNISLRNLTFFWWAPTLIYQPAYPRTERVRWDFVAKRTGECIIACFIIWVINVQYAVPLLQNSLADMSELNLVGIVERVLKLSTISVVCWLAGFYAVFQSALNALAEFMRFGDRDFYGDWWNCTDVRSYWTSWNKPVANFMKRHIYAPMVGRGVPPALAQILTFLFSAALHELLVGVPTHNILGLAFAGMVFQIPLILITDTFRKREGYFPKLIGNLTFWCTFCLVGQPLAALGYYFAWQAKYGSSRPEYPNIWPANEKT